MKPKHNRARYVQGRMLSKRVRSQRWERPAYCFWARMGRVRWFHEVVHYPHGTAVFCTPADD